MDCLCGRTWKIAFQRESQSAEGSAKVDQIGSLLKTLQDSVLGATIARSPWLFPTIETIHVVAISLVIGSIFILDLRLIGRLWTHLPVSKLAGQTLPWTWTSFIFAVISGSLM